MVEVVRDAVHLAFLRLDLEARVGGAGDRDGVEGEVRQRRMARLGWRTVSKQVLRSGMGMEPLATTAKLYQRLVESIKT